MYPDPDADPHPALFIIDLQDANKKTKGKLVEIKGFLTIFA
jgi:hypothetical protein